MTLKPGVGSFKVIENGAVRYIIYDFLLVCHCKIWLYLLLFLSYLTLSNRDPEIWVSKGHSNWYHSKAWCSFLFAFHGNYGQVS